MIAADGIRSPNGAWNVTTSPWEARMSLWIESPSLIDVQSGAALFAFNDVHWSLDAATWLSDSVVEWRLRKYPGNHLPIDLVVRIDCERRCVEFNGKDVPLASLESALDAAMTWSA